MMHAFRAKDIDIYKPDGHDERIAFSFEYFDPNKERKLHRPQLTCFLKITVSM